MTKKEETKKIEKTLSEQLIDMKNKLQQLHLDHRLGKLKNSGEIKITRREIARIKTKENLQKIIEKIES